MEVIIKACDVPANSYIEMTNCIKDTYSKVGNTPDSMSVRGFYARIDSTTEAIKSKSITEKQGRALVYKDYSETVGLENYRAKQNQGTVCMPINGMVFCQ